jgi:hypothetical protein
MLALCCVIRLIALAMAAASVNTTAKIMVVFLRGAASSVVHNHFRHLGTSSS